MKSSEDILNEVRQTFSTKWTAREGRKVPVAEDITLENNAVTIEGTVLYADMAESTNLVNSYKSWFSAEVYKTYLEAACHIIRNNSGEITAFDGDRVMAVFIGSSKNSAAAKAALNIKYIVGQINLALKEKYPNSSYQLRQSVGIDSSELFVTKAGVRNANDLIWVGTAANYAAKLSSLDGGSYSTFITEKVFNSLSDASKFGGEPKQCMWQKDLWKETGAVIYKSSWFWGF